MLLFIEDVQIDLIFPEDIKHNQRGCEALRAEPEPVIAQRNHRFMLLMEVVDPDPDPDPDWPAA